MILPNSFSHLCSNSLSPVLHPALRSRLGSNINLLLEFHQFVPVVVVSRVELFIHHVYLSLLLLESVFEEEFDWLVKIEEDSVMLFEYLCLDV